MSRDAYVEATRVFYGLEVQRHGFSYKGLGYRRQSSQRARFDVLAGVGDLHGARLLDVGAGLGDFRAYLRKREIEVDYTGLELCDHLAAEARRRFRGEPRCRFVTGDVLDHAPEEPYDVVVASGIFGLETGHTAERIPRTLARLFALCRRATSVNFLSARAARHAPRSLYLAAEDLLALALSLTPKVALRHDYLPNDFTLYLYRKNTPAQGEEDRR